MFETDGNKNIFVFVVCGSKEHIETLNFSLHALKKFSNEEIIIITDSSRNEIPVEHSHVIDIKTPEHFNNHQASIYLKTGIHKFLPKDNLYCYLDTDVVAINSEVDKIFGLREGVINFSTDHCKVPQFSPYAVHCGCIENNKNERKELALLLKKYDGQDEITDPVILKKRDVLVKKFQTIKTDKLNYLLISVRFLLSPFVFKLDEDTYYHRWKKYWFDKYGNVLLYAKPKAGVNPIEKNTDWHWNKKSQHWISPAGNDIEEIKCHHLTDFIFQKFNIIVEDKNWQHWNGGVFVFDEKSHDFLEAWHQKTLQIFDDKNWQTRDQGTLIATAWEFGIQSQKTIPIEFNFLADYHHPTMKYLQDFTFCFKDTSQKVKPNFLHIYHQWGNNDWDVWRDLKSLINSLE